MLKFIEKALGTAVYWEDLCLISGGIEADLTLEARKDTETRGLLGLQPHPETIYRSFLKTDEEHLEKAAGRRDCRTPVSWGVCQF